MFYKILDLPQIPPNLVDEIISYASDPEQIELSVLKLLDTSFLIKTISSPKIITYKNGATRSSAIYKRFYVPDTVYNWSLSNIDKNIKNPSFNKFDSFNSTIGKFNIQVFNHNKNNEILSFYPHTDGIRAEYVLNYIIKTGGNNVKTQWFRHKNDDIYKPKLINNGHTECNHENLTLQDEIVFTKNQWALIDARPLHAIDNLESTRIALSISYKKIECPWAIN